MTESHKAKAYWILLCMLAGSIILSLYRISDCRMTMDEFFSINIAQRSLGEMWSLKSHPMAFYFNRFPPMYETVLHFVWRVSNGSLFWSRVLSIVFNAAALFMIFLISRTLFNKKAALIAVSLAAVNYAYLFFSKMIRCYPFFNFLVLASFYVFFRMAKSRAADNKSLVFLLLLNTAILYTFYFGFFVILLEALLCALFFSRKIRVKIWSFLAGSFILFLPWTGHFLDNISKEPAFRFSLTDPGKFLDVLLVRLQNGIFHGTGLFIFYSCVCLLFLLSAVYLAFKKDDRAPLIISLLAILFLPVFIITYLTSEVNKGFIVSVLMEPERARYMLAFIFPFFILAGLLISGLPRKPGGLLFVILLFCSAYILGVYYRLPTREGFWPAQLAPLAQEAKDFPVVKGEKAVVEIEDSFFVPLFVYYFYAPRYFREASVPYGGANLKKINGQAGNNYTLVFNVAGIKRFHSFNSVARLPHFDRLYLIYSDWLGSCWGKPFRQLYEEKLEEGGLQKNISLLKKDSVGGFTLEIYEIKK